MMSEDKSCSFLHACLSLCKADCSLLRNIFKRVPVKENFGVLLRQQNTGNDPEKKVIPKTDQVTNIDSEYLYQKDNGQ